MKATIIVTSFILFAALMGCSDNFNVNDPLNNHISSQTKNPASHKTETLWELDELTVNASSEFMAENIASYSNGPLKMISNYHLKFDVYTNANKFTNGYTPIVNVFRDGEMEFTGSQFPVVDGEAISHVDIKMNNVRFTDLVLYIVLHQSDRLPKIINDEKVVLRLSKIALYCRD